MNKKKIIIIISLSILIAITSFFIFLLYNLSPVNKNSDDLVTFKIESGWGKNKIIEELKKDNLIRNDVLAKIIIKFNKKELYAGTYKLSKDMSTNEIINIISNQKNIENETINVTFIEGKRLESYVDTIVDNFNLDKNQVLEKLSDKDYLDSLIDKYWFLTDEIYNDKIYYPLEGYLYPDTYEFKKSSTLEEVIDIMLRTMGEKLEDYKEDINVSKYTIHELITLASIVELEGVNSNDRGLVAGVFYNRLANNSSLGSDVTTYYAVKKTFAQELTQKDLSSCNGYNTRGSCVTGLPVGPICSPSLSSISAAIDPIDNDYYYFVADKDKNTYFSKTYQEHAKIVSTLKDEGKWYTY